MILWQEFTNTHEPKDHESIIFYSASNKKVYCAEYLDEGFVRIFTKEGWMLIETIDINYDKDLWMSLPSAPGKIRKTRSDKVIRGEFHGKLPPGIIPSPRKRKKKNEMD